MLATTQTDLESTRHTLSRNGIELPVLVFELTRDGDRAEVRLFGEISGNPLVRIHSSCRDGESLRAENCDCGQQLDEALDRIFKGGGGILVYLHQEGRSCGIIAKAHGMNLSEQTGLDSFAAYKALNLPEDGRSFAIAADALDEIERRLGLPLPSIRLLTNNQDKIDAIDATGRRVTRLPLWILLHTERGRSYQMSKVRRGHLNPPPELIEPARGGRPSLQLLGPLLLATLAHSGCGLRARRPMRRAAAEAAVTRVTDLAHEAWNDLLDLVVPLPLPDAAPAVP
ncbi:GTP cyclohydrolase [Nocardia terpenica]|uniref:GTP cyclohydrolase n=1 Tax=Nocardia terpenica TaxID=455432 RepID=A0A6G9Z3Q1_9NOCA|nr:GTP cyclohydrolase [Nocardia terpenica]QIS20219.1 GTP cyclohydrolase [Nocardia terpenica]